MGFLSAASSGFLEGAAGQGNQDFANARQMQNTALLRQQQMVDQVASQNNQMRAKAADIAAKQTSYMTQYNIPSDQAYSLATDPSFGNASDEERQARIARMKPTGSYTPAIAATQSQVQGLPNNRGPFGIGNFSVPPVTVPGMPAQPPRQIYTEAGNAGMTPQQNGIVKNLADSILSGGTDIPGAYKAYKAQTGTDAPPGTFESYKYNPSGKDTPGQTEAKLNQEIADFQKAHPGTSWSAAYDQVKGYVREQLDTQGNTKITDRAKGTSSTVRDPNYVPAGVEKDAYDALRQSSNLIRQTSAVAALFEQTPEAAGVTGKAIDQWGGQVVNTLRAFGMNDQAAAVNSAVGVNKVQNARNALTALNVELAKPLTQDPRVPLYVRQQLSQITADDTHHTVEQILDSTKMIKSYYLANVIDNMSVANHQILAGLDAQPGTPQFKAAWQNFQKNAVNTFGLHIGPDDMRSLTGMAIRMAHGQDPYDLKQVFGQVSQQVNGPTAR